MITLGQIKKDVEELCEVDLGNKSRKRRLVEARSLYYEMALRFTNKSMERITEQVNRHYATLISARNKDFFTQYSDYGYKEERNYLIAKYAEQSENNNYNKNKEVTDLLNSILSIESRLRVLKNEVAKIVA